MLRPRGSLHTWCLGSSVPLSQSLSSLLCALPPTPQLSSFAPTLRPSSIQHPLLLTLFRPWAGPGDAQGDEVCSCPQGGPCLAGETEESIPTQSCQCPDGGEAGGPGSPGVNQTLETSVRDDLWEEVVMLRPEREAEKHGSQEEG